MENKSAEMYDYIEGAAYLGNREMVYGGKPCNGSWSCGGGCYGSTSVSPTEGKSSLASMIVDSL